MSLRVYYHHGEMNGHMKAVWYLNGQWSATTPCHNTTDNWLDFSGAWPMILTIELSGKNPQTDTLVHNGEIVADKHLAIVGMELGRYPVAPTVIGTICNFCPDDEPPRQQSYFHRNGVVTVTFDEKDILTWHLKRNIIHIP